MFRLCVDRLVASTTAMANFPLLKLSFAPLSLRLSESELSDNSANAIAVTGSRQFSLPLLLPSWSRQLEPPLFFAFPFHLVLRSELR